jgi:hypothetical protein
LKRDLLSDRTSETLTSPRNSRNPETQNPETKPSINPLRCPYNSQGVLAKDKIQKASRKTSPRAKNEKKPTTMNNLGAARDGLATQDECSSSQATSRGNPEAAS